MLLPGKLLRFGLVELLIQKQKMDISDYLKDSLSQAKFIPQIFFVFLAPTALYVMAIAFYCLGASLYIFDVGVDFVFPSILLASIILLFGLVVNLIFSLVVERKVKNLKKQDKHSKFEEYAADIKYVFSPFIKQLNEEKNQFLQGENHEQRHLRRQLERAKRQDQTKVG